MKAEKITKEGLVDTLQGCIEDLLVASELLNDCDQYEDADYDMEAWKKVDIVKNQIRGVLYSIQVHKRLFTEEELQEEANTTED